MLEIAKTTDGPPGVGTVYASTVKDAGMKTKREFKLTEFEAPTRIRWAEQSKNLVTAPEGGYDLAQEGSGTRLTVYNVLEGHGPGKLIAPLALRSARKGADDFAKAIKAAVLPTGSGGTGPSPSHSTSASSGAASGTIMSGSSGGLSACAAPSGDAVPSAPAPRRQRQRLDRVERVGDCRSPSTTE